VRVVVRPGGGDQARDHTPGGAESQLDEFDPARQVLSRGPRDGFPREKRESVPVPLHHRVQSNLCGHFVRNVEESEIGRGESGRGDGVAQRRQNRHPLQLQ
jgi:hypothetical protein